MAVRLLLARDGRGLTGVRKDSATKRARAFNCGVYQPYALWGCIGQGIDTYEELHLRDFLVHLFHELNDEVNQLMLQHGLRVEIRDQERDIIALLPVSILSCRIQRGQLPDLYRLPPQNEERLCSLGQEPGELVDEDMLDFIGLLYSDTDTDTVHARFNEDLFVLVSRHR